MTEPPRAVFLSYASQDAEAARRICEALRAGGIEVWFDQSELRGGDAWDIAIRRQIRTCALFIPIVSRNTHAREEGYFRLEWKLAVDRSHLMTGTKAFLLPVVIDDTRDDDEHVPDKFREVQWTRLSDGNTPPNFVERISRLLSPAEVHATGIVSGSAAASKSATAYSSARRISPTALVFAAVVVLTAGYITVDKLVLSKRGTDSGLSTSNGPSVVPVQAAIPEKSVAVLPFVDMSEKKDQEYFSDGLSEELLDLLAQVQDLKVPGRTSSFYFKGKQVTIAEIAKALGVAHVLEGSVRKAGNTLRVTVQLIRADSGYHLWSKTYDRPFNDIFKVQDEIAAAVVEAMKAKIAVGPLAPGARGTTNTEAYSEYLIGQRYARRGTLEGSLLAAQAFRKAIALDSKYAAAYSKLGVIESDIAASKGDAVGLKRAAIEVEKAIALAPDQAMGYVARADLRISFDWDWIGARADIDKARALEPGYPGALFVSAYLFSTLGRLPEAIAELKKSLEFDPLAIGSLERLGLVYAATGDFAASSAALNRALQLESLARIPLYIFGMLKLVQGDGQEALEAFRKIDEEGFRLTGIAQAQHTLGNAAESQRALEELIEKYSTADPYQIAEIYAWRKEPDKAFEWLERSYRQRDSGLADIKCDPLVESIRADPRYKTLLRKMNLPE